MEPEYFKDADGNLVERITTDRIHDLEGLKMQLMMLQSDQSRVTSEIARLSNLLEQFSAVK